MQEPSLSLSYFDSQGCSHLRKRCSVFLKGGHQFIYHNCYLPLSASSIALNNGFLSQGNLFHCRFTLFLNSSNEGNNNICSNNNGGNAKQEDDASIVFNFHSTVYLFSPSLSLSLSLFLIQSTVLLCFIFLLGLSCSHSSTLLHPKAHPHTHTLHAKSISFSSFYLTISFHF